MMSLMDICKERDETFYRTLFAFEEALFCSLQKSQKSFKLILFLFLPFFNLQLVVAENGAEAALENLQQLSKSRASTQASAEQKFCYRTHTQGARLWCGDATADKLGI